MEFGYLFTSLEGRIGRKLYWLGVVLLVALAVAVMVLIVFAGVALVGTVFSFVTFVIELAFLYPASALLVKRLHDRNRPGYFAAFILAPLIVKSLTDLLGVTGGASGLNPFDYLLGLTIFLVSLWFFIELGCLRGTVGANRYGPDPLRGSSAPSPDAH
jgi:uncharacterized membrane protein YhaH (DUF805 family)